MKKVFDNRENVLYNITRVIARCSMVLDVKRIINTPGGRIPFDFTEDFSDVDFGGVCPAVRPVSVVGQAENIAGMLRLQFDLTTTLSAVCDRCGAPFDLPYKVPFECLLADGAGGRRQRRYPAAGQRNPLISASWRGRRSSSICQARPFAARIAGACVPAAASISTMRSAAAKRKSTPG